ncbi:SGNH/GDSL hydrolase family protein [Saccharopolyspora griseoalba]|uniref:SGNH/GDSL hydrolase family protein n=1 Tax=Saccharopolyspora griseoalba TaxID=1431848 RepID=A0ABW2LJ95_9PSEU
MVRFSLAVASAIAVAALPVAPAQAADSFEYVAMGDSAAAGPLVPDPDPNLLCFRSTNNYPQVAAAELGADLTDVTCSGAETEDFAGRQHLVLPPQYDALSPSTDLVTVSIGGNDIDLVQAAVSCLNPLPEPIARSCADRFTAEGDELADRVEALTPDIDAVLDEITARAPDARVVVVGYGTYIRPGGCYPAQPVLPRDADYLQSSVDKLSEMLAERAAAHGASFVDLRPVSEGHDVCAPKGEKYFEGFVPTAPAAPLHPNERGMAAFGRAVAEEVGSRDLAG